MSSIQQQNQRFNEALARGEITQAEYDRAMAIQRQQASAQQASPLPQNYWSSAVQNSTSTPTKPPSPLPTNYWPQAVATVDPAYAHAYAQAQQATPYGYELIGVQQEQVQMVGPLRGPSPERPTITQYRATYRPTPVLESAFAKYEREPELSAKVITNRSPGTRTDSAERNIGYFETGQGVKQIDWSKYTPEEQEALRSYLQGENIKRLTNLSLVLAAPLAAIIAPKVALIGAGINLAVAQGFKAYQGEGLLTTEEVGRSVGEGVIFSVVGMGAVRLVGSVAPKILTPIVGVASKSAKAIGVGGRALVNVGVDAGQGFLMSGGDVESAGRSAVFGGVFSLGFDAASYVGSKVPLPKFGKVAVDLEPEPQNRISLEQRGQLLVQAKQAIDQGDTQRASQLLDQLETSQPKVTWKGLYLSRGEEATILVGKMSDVPEGAIIKSHGVSGEDVGYVPRSNIEAEVTQRVMQKTGSYDIETLQDIKDIRGLMSSTQNVKSKYIEDLLPVETQTLSQKGVATVKSTVIEQKESVEKLYGSFTQKAQVSKKFEYALETPKGTISALRQPADIDVQLKVSEEEAGEFTTKLTKKLQGVGETVRISKEKPTLIESFRDGTWRHAVDIHSISDQTDIPKQAWGFKIAKPTTTIENIPSQALNEQGLAKGVSILGFKEDTTIGPVEHRAKDIPDFLQAQRTLLESKQKISDKDIIRLGRLTGRFGASDLSTPVRQEIIVHHPSSMTPYYTSPAPSSSLIVSSPRMSNSQKSYSVPIQSPSQILSKPSQSNSLISQESKSRLAGKSKPSTTSFNLSQSIVPTSPSKSPSSSPLPYSTPYSLSIPSYPSSSRVPYQLLPSDFKLESNDGNMLFSSNLTSLEKRIRHYPVVDPLETMGFLF